MNEGRAVPGVDGIFRSLHLHNLAAERAEPLDRLVGSWHVEGRCRPFGHGAWEAVAGEAEGRWVVGGRYLQVSMATEMAGLACNSLNVICYDALIARFLDVWFDNVGVGLYRASGVFDPASFVLAMEREFANPVTGARERIRTVWDFANPAAIGLQLLRPGSGTGSWDPFVELLLRRTPVTPADGFRHVLAAGADAEDGADAAQRRPADPDLVDPLDRLLGSWDIEVDFLLLGTDHHMMAFGVAHGNAVMGGRFVQLDVLTESDAVPTYRALIILAGNSVTKGFESVMFDNTLTSMVMLDGTYDAAASTLSEVGEHTNPAFGKRHPLRTMWNFADPDNVELLWDAPLGADNAWKRIMRVAMRRRTD